MTSNALDVFIERTRSVWGPLTTDMATNCRASLEGLLQAPMSEPWLSALHAEASETKELYRDPQHGFVLLVHAEFAGLYRPPHDHGRSWGIYAVQKGEIEMATYARIEDPDGKVRLVKRDETLVRPGQSKVFLPGDIHDTHCVSGPALLYRFTERDLKKEDKEEHRVTRYAERDGIWTVGLA